MWHEDLLAWQQIRQTPLVSPVGPSVLQLCVQDPTRVYLSISIVNPVSQVSLRVWPVALFDAGLPLGSGPQPLAGSITHFQAVAGIAGGTLDGTFDPSGDTWAGTYTTTNDEFALNFPDPDEVDLSLDASKTAPQERVFRWPEDGILCQQSWGVFDSFGSQNYFVLEVLMPNRPCPTWRLPNGDNRPRVRLQGGHQSVGRGGNVIDPLAWPQRPPPGADILPNES